MKAPHIAIIGAGIIGAALAHRLAKSGARVTVLESGMPASLASGASFGWLNASFFASPAHFHLRHAALLAHRALDRELDTGTLWQGTLWYEETGPAFAAQAAGLAGLGYPVRHISQAAFRALEPGVANPPEQALCFPGEGAVDAAALTRALLAAAASHGAQVWLGCEVARLHGSPDRISGVATAEGVLAADQVILAAGCATPGLLAPLGLTLPMLQRPGLMVQTRPIARALRHILVTPGQEVRQSLQGHLIAPAAASHQSDSAEVIGGLPGDLAAATLARLRALLPGHDLRLDRVARANRPVPGDGLPVVGPAGPEGLYLATMHSGVTLAPLVADLVAAEVLAGQAAPLLAAFRPSRFFDPARR